MFGVQFYPTPPKVAERMLDDLKPLITKGTTILEPQAGRGDLVRKISWNTLAQKENIYCIEIDPDLQALLRGHGYHVIGDDFLSYSGTLMFDVIIMNPPFANGVKHLLKAWEIVRPGGVVRCLLNYDNLYCGDTRLHDLVWKIIDDYGCPEDLGRPFSDADRETDVRVCMVTLMKPEREDLGIKWKTTQAHDMIDVTIEPGTDELVAADLIGAYLDCYARIGNAYLNYIKAEKELLLLTGAFTSTHSMEHCSFEKALEDGKSKLTYGEGTLEERMTKSHNAFMLKIQRYAWATVFSNTKLHNFSTTRVVDEFKKWLDEQGGQDFTFQNIMSVFQSMIDNRGQIMEQCLMDVFDWMTKYHKENRCHIEGWKTNDAYKVNQKVIIPGYIDVSSLKYGGSFYIYRHDKIDDIDKVMCMLTGKRFEELSEEGGLMSSALRKRFNEMRNPQVGQVFDNNVESEFFELKFFKKGTLHFKFKDKKLWENFNLQVAKGKGWLPG